MRRLLHGFDTLAVLFLAAYLCLAQPGLCPYWMVADPSILAAADEEAGHTHHDHNQQRESFVTVSAPALPQAALTATALLALLADAALKLILADGRLVVSGWHPPTQLRPPRGATLAV